MAETYEITGEPKAGGFIQQHELDLIETLPTAPTVFDVGASIGDFTQAVLERRPDARVLAFEPQEEAQRQLRQRFGSRITVLGALGRAAETRELYSDVPGSQLGTFLPRNIPEVQMRSQGAVEVSTLADVCRAHDVEHIDLLKLDCEGFEYEVLFGAAYMLDHVGLLYWEMMESDPHPYETGVTMEDYWRLLGSRFAVTPMNAIHCKAVRR